MLNFTSNIYTPNFLLLLKLFAMPQRAPMAQIYIQVGDFFFIGG